MAVTGGKSFCVVRFTFPVVNHLHFVSSFGVNFYACDLLTSWVKIFVWWKAQITVLTVFDYYRQLTLWCHHAIMMKLLIPHSTSVISH